ncbi:hypothetical protein BDY21DRAFT_354162 [Lineolata rhizophorae]|uniref:Secreted protein n=1 Tax=Lineolata rhizophorae TaxID=578093 RepID=A0A6A6NRR0_9PEZI|nr:hypothetical protein BDY21DRAFT_354162 [Lineolata rhizophorae]
MMSYFVAKILLVVWNNSGGSGECDGSVNSRTNIGYDKSMIKLCMHGGSNLPMLLVTCVFCRPRLTGLGIRSTCGRR